MRSALSSFLTTAVMFGSLLAIPALAVFGIPDFAKIARWVGSHEQADQFEDEFEPIADAPLYSPFIAADPSDAPDWDEIPAPPSGQSEPPVATPSIDGAGFEPIPRERIAVADVRRDEPIARNPLRGWQPDPSRVERAGFAQPIETTRVSQSAESVPAVERTPEVADRGQAFESRTDNLHSSDPVEGGDSPLTWISAVEQLNALGIRQYRLQPGSSPNVFHFSCHYTPPENPRIYHRFEAEADDPLIAVSNVLKQVVQWHQQP